MAEATLVDKIHDLSDLEIATLLCLTAQEHCIIDAVPEVIDDLTLELELVTLPTLLFVLSLNPSDCFQRLRIVICCH